MAGAFSNDLRHECPIQDIRAGRRTSAEDLDFRTIPAEVGGMNTMTRNLRKIIDIEFSVGAHAAGKSTRLHIERAISELQFSLPGVPPLWKLTGEDLLRALALQRYGHLGTCSVEADGPTLEVHPAGALHGVWVSGDAGTVRVIWVLDLECLLPYARRPQDVSLPTKLLQCASKFEISWGRAEDLGTREGGTALTTAWEGKLRTIVYVEPVPAIEIPVLMVMDGLDLVGVQPTIAPVEGRYVGAALYRPGGWFGAAEARTMGVRWGSRVYAEDTIPTSIPYLEAQMMRGGPEFGWLDDPGDVASTDDLSAAHFLPVYLPQPGRDGIHLGSIQDGRAQLRIKLDTLANMRTRMVRILALWHGGELNRIRQLLELPAGAPVRPITASHKPHPDPFMAQNGLPLKVTAA